MALFIKSSENVANSPKIIQERVSGLYQDFTNINSHSKLSNIDFPNLFKHTHALNSNKLVEFLVEQVTSKESLLESKENINDKALIENELSYLKELSKLAIDNNSLLLQESNMITGPLKDIYNYAERKLKGYSAGQVDRLIEKAIKIKNESDKHSIIKDCNNAIEEAREELNKSKQELSNAKKMKKDSSKIENHVEALEYQIDVLNKLKNKVMSIDVSHMIDKGREHEEHDSERHHYKSDEEKRRINLDESFYLNKRLNEEICLLEDKAKFMRMYHSATTHSLFRTVDIEVFEEEEYTWLRRFLVSSYKSVTQTPMANLAYGYSEKEGKMILGSGLVGNNKRGNELDNYEQNLLQLLLHVRSPEDKRVLLAQVDDEIKKLKVTGGLSKKAEDDAFWRDQIQSFLQFPILGNIYSLLFHSLTSEGEFNRHKDRIKSLIRVLEDFKKHVQGINVGDRTSYIKEDSIEEEVRPGDFSYDRYIQMHKYPDKQYASEAYKQYASNMINHIHNEKDRQLAIHELDVEIRVLETKGIAGLKASGSQVKNHTWNGAMVGNGIAWLGGGSTGDHLLLTAIGAGIGYAMSDNEHDERRKVYELIRFLRDLQEYIRRMKIKK